MSKGLSHNIRGCHIRGCWHVHLSLKTHWMEPYKMRQDQIIEAVHFYAFRVLNDTHFTITQQTPYIWPNWLPPFTIPNPAFCLSVSLWQIITPFSQYLHYNIALAFSYHSCTLILLFTLLLCYECCYLAVDQNLITLASQLRESYLNNSSVHIKPTDISLIMLLSVAHRIQQAKTAMAGKCGPLIAHITL